MANVSRFENGPLNASIRVVSTPSGPVFVLSDVAKILGYRDAPNAAHLLRPTQTFVADQATKKDLGVTGRAPMLVTESGFYRLCLRSRRPEAEAFQVWVEDEVLPAIRRDGGYLNPERTPWQNERLAERIQYRTVKDLIAGSSDYSTTDPATRQVFAGIQNLFHKAVTGKTAKQLIASRDIERWTGAKGPTKHDRGVGKNYLTEGELKVYTALGDYTTAHMRLFWPKGGYALADIHTAVSKAMDIAVSAGVVQDVRM